MQERRLHPRHDSFIKVDYLVLGSWYRGSIQNISEGGAYIRSNEEGEFLKGHSILMLVEFGVLLTKSGARSVELNQTVSQ